MTNSPDDVSALNSNGSAARDPIIIPYIGDPFNPPLMAVISVAGRLQEFLLATGALDEGQSLPFPELYHR